jgi:hypothetical protein
MYLVLVADLLTDECHLRNTPIISDQQANSKEHIMRRVSFSQISIRSFDLCIGDSPAVLTGVPISLDWTFTESPPLSVDDFEDNRSQVRRSRQELKMSVQHRHRKLVYDFGVPEEAVNQRVAQRSIFPRNPERLKVFASQVSATQNMTIQREMQFDDHHCMDKSRLVSPRTKAPSMLSKIPVMMCSIPNAA